MSEELKYTDFSKLEPQLKENQLAVRVSDKNLAFALHTLASVLAGSELRSLASDFGTLTTYPLPQTNLIAQFVHYYVTEKSESY